MKILIACYSWKGHTETVARALGQKIGAPVVRIEPVVDPGRHIAMTGLKAFFGRREPIKATRTDLANVDHLVVATPVWSHNIPPFTRQYLTDLTNCSGKKFSVLAEMGGTGAGSVVKKVRRILEGKGMKFVASAATIEKDVDAGTFQETLDEFVKKIQTG